MRLFRSEEEVAAWQEASGERGGVTIPVTQLQRLARAWYGDRLDPAWRPRTTARSQALLGEAGLSGPFWRLG
jgi:hypothetical protein